MTQPAAVAATAGFSKIKEAVALWDSIRQLLRSGEDGCLVPVVIPRDRRGLGWAALLGLAAYTVGVGLAATDIPTGTMLGVAGVLVALGIGSLWRSSIVEIEQGTTGVISRYGEIVGTLGPGRHYLWWPWEKVDFVVDTSTEIPYTAPVLACPTRENVPLKSIEFFLKFRIVDPVLFVRHIGAGNFDTVLSSAVQDAIRNRSRAIETARAYDLRGADVGDMQETLNRKLSVYGVKILGANIPDVQLPDQYQQNLATRERVAKEQVAYEKEWELTRKQRSDTLLLEIERAKKERDATEIAVKAATNKAREDVARMLQERETEAEKVRLEIEARGRARLAAAENEAKALRHLGSSYRDNRAVLQYELAQQRLGIASKLAQAAPRPILVSAEGGDLSALSTLLLAQLLPGLAAAPKGPETGPSAATETPPAKPPEA